MGNVGLRSSRSLRLTERVEQGGEPGFVEAGHFAGNIPDGAASFVSFPGNLSGAVVTDDRREGGAHREALFEVALAFLGIDFESGHATAGEDTAGGGQEVDGLQEVVGGHGEHGVELKAPQVPLKLMAASLPRTWAPTWIDHFGHHRVDLAGHDGGGRLRGRDS